MDALKRHKKYMWSMDVFERQNIPKKSFDKILTNVCRLLDTDTRAGAFISYAWKLVW
jgi:hypothetical protein